MMISFARAGGALLLLAPLAVLQAQGVQVKIAYVDTRYIVSGAPGTPAAEAKLNKDIALMDAQAKKMSDSLDALTAAFNKEQATLAGAARDARLKAIQERQSEFQQKYQALQQQAQDRRDEVMQPILDQIKLVLEDIRQEGGYTMIFDVSQTGTIVAADKNLNISDRVLAKLRTMPLPTVADQPGGAAQKAAPTGAPMSVPAGVGRPPSSTVPPKGDSTRKKPDTTAAKKKPAASR